jgi:two-component system KDP operon response regulator KdpE
MPVDLILIIDDEPPIRRAVRGAVEPTIGRVVEAASGREGIDCAATDRPALIVLDLGLPDMEGVSVCQELRRRSTVPILVLSARQTAQDKVALLDAGADDFITKPFSTIELQARIRAALRRSRLATSAPAGGPLCVGTVRIDFETPRLLREDQPVHLTRTEWQLLRTLARHAGRTMTHRQIFVDVWGNGHGDAQQYLRVHIRSLRRKIEMDPVRPRLIVTEPGVGYRFEGAG